MTKKRSNSKSYAINWRYAIGEIAIVSIGILLAFQLNTWKGNRLDHKSEIKALNMMVNEMVKDSASFYAHYKNAIYHKQDALAILQLLNSDNPLAFADSMMNAFRRCGTYSPNILHRSAFLMMTAQGTLNLIKNDTVRNAIYNYYDQTHELAGEFARFQERMVNNVLPKVHEEGIIDDERVLQTNGLKIYYHPQQFIEVMMMDENRGKMALYMRSQNDLISITHLNRMRNRNLLKRLRKYVSKL